MDWYQEAAAWILAGAIQLDPDLARAIGERGWRPDPADGPYQEVVFYLTRAIELARIWRAPAIGERGEQLIGRGPLMTRRRADPTRAIEA